ncbi:dolichyl-phosphate beta-glucosyltransferase [Passer domesticus]|uniref:dolichyl-phosphate beta-glucosyltransferase n=1 Tax=Passer domesticus TaxID=48849 RepID=UPI0030FEACAF
MALPPLPSLPLSLPAAALALATLAAFLLVLICVIAHVTAKTMPHEDAECRKGSAPNIRDPATRGLSVVVPSYNEENRLPLMMDEALDYLEKRQKQDPSFTYEVIVVNDGSKDQTAKVAKEYCKKYGSDKVRVISLEKNRGKGGAVRTGVFSSRGKTILMADADGATKFADIEKVEEGLKNLQPWPEGMAISCGSRAHLEKDSIAKRSYFRTLLMYGFHFLVWFLCVKEIRDTQCGFKLLTREAALQTFSNLHIERWAFDVELLYIAQRLKIPIAEVAVNWTEIEGSKLVPFWSWLQMGRDLLFIRLRYMTGAWKLEAKKCN